MYQGTSQKSSLGPQSVTCPVPDGTSSASSAWFWQAFPSAALQCLTSLLRQASGSDFQPSVWMPKPRISPGLRCTCTTRNVQDLTPLWGKPHRRWDWWINSSPFLLWPECPKMRLTLLTGGQSHDSRQLHLAGARLITHSIEPLPCMSFLVLPSQSATNWGCEAIEIYCLPGGETSEIKVLTEPCSFWGVCGRICACLFQLPVALDSPWLVDASLQSHSPSPHAFSLSVFWLGHKSYWIKDPPPLLV